MSQIPIPGIEPEPEPCAGLHRCHGCMQWCAWCGDLPRVSCDDPECDIHKRWSERDEELMRLRKQIQVLEELLVAKTREIRGEIKSIQDEEIAVANDAIQDFKRLGNHMVPRGSRMDLVRKVMDS